MKPETPQTISQLMREGNRFTDRHFMKALGVGHPALKRREADPSQFTLDEVIALAEMLQRPPMEIAVMILDEMKRNLKTKEKAAEVKETVSKMPARKLFPRTPNP